MPRQEVHPIANPGALGSLGPLLLGATFLLAGNALLVTAVPVRLEESGHGPLVTGLVVTGYFLGFGLGSFRADRVVARVGHVRAFAGFAAGLAAAAISHALVPPSPPAWLALRLVAGFSIAGLYLVNESWMNAAGEGGDRGRTLAIYMATTHLAIAAGQILFGLSGGDGLLGRRFALATLLVCLGVVPVSLYTVRAPPIEFPRALSLRALAGVAPLGLAAALGSGAIAGAIYGMGPVFAKTTAVPVGGVSTFMTTIVLGGLVFQLPMGRWSDRMDRRRVLAATALGTALAALLLIPARAAPGGAAVALTALLGGLALTVYPLGLAHVFDRIERKDALAAVGAMLASYAVGSTTGPILASAGMQALGPEGLPVFVAAVGALLGTYALTRIRQVAPVPVAEQAPFVATTRTTAAAAEMDPRTPDGDEEDAEHADGSR